MSDLVKPGCTFLDKHQRNERRAWLVGFVAVILAANWLTATFGVVSVMGLSATAGTLVAGCGFVARDGLHDSAGPRWVAIAILLGAVLSAVLSPALALASGVAFLLGELADFAVYAPLRRRGKVRAALASNAVGSVVDTYLFLAVARFPLALAPTQLVVKVIASTAAVGVLRAVFR